MLFLIRGKYCTYSYIIYFLLESLSMNHHQEITSSNQEILLEITERFPKISYQAGKS